MARPAEWGLATLYIMSVVVLALLSVTLGQGKVAPWPLENLGLMGAFFSILSLLLVMALRARLTKYYLVCSFILMTVALLGFFILEDKCVSTAPMYANQPDFRYLTGWSTTKRGDEIIQRFKALNNPNPDLGNGAAKLPDIYNGFRTISRLYTLAYVLMLSGFVLTVGGLMFAKQAAPPIPPPIIVPMDTSRPSHTGQDPVAVRTNAAPTPAARTDRQVFISYAWGGESEETADKLVQAFKERGVTIVRDKSHLRFRGRLKAFMKSIGRGKCVILVISDKYLKSPNCLFELIQVGKNEDFTERIFPVVLDDALIYKPEERIDYVRYWEQAIEVLEARMREQSPANMQGFREDIDLYTKIRASLPRLIDKIRDMNTLTSDIHRESNFKELVEAVMAKLAANEDEKTNEKGDAA